MVDVQELARADAKTRSMWQALFVFWIINNYIILDAFYRPIGACQGELVQITVSLQRFELSNQDCIVC